jgi:hypothetical protein
MPNYKTQVPPYSIFPGDVAFAFNSEAPSAGQASQPFALPSYAGFLENGRTLHWQTIYGTAPSATSVVLQTAMIDSDSQLATIDTFTNTSGEARTVTGVRANFARAKVSFDHRRSGYNRSSARLADSDRSTAGREAAFATKLRATVCGVPGRDIPAGAFFHGSGATGCAANCSAGPEAPHHRQIQLQLRSEPRLRL